MTLKLNTGENRREYLKAAEKILKANLTVQAAAYAKLPPNIRAAIAKVAEVDNRRLDDLSLADRQKLSATAFNLSKKITEAYGILRMASVSTGANS